MRYVLAIGCVRWSAIGIRPSLYPSNRANIRCSIAPISDGLQLSCSQTRIVSRDLPLQPANCRLPANRRRIEKDSIRLQIIKSVHILFDDFAHASQNVRIRSSFALSQRHWTSKALLRRLGYPFWSYRSVFDNNTPSRGQRIPTGPVGPEQTRQEKPLDCC